MGGHGNYTIGIGHNHPGTHLQHILECKRMEWNLAQRRVWNGAVEVSQVRPTAFME